MAWTPEQRQQYERVAEAAWLQRPKAQRVLSEQIAFEFWDMVNSAYEGPAAIAVLFDKHAKNWEQT